MFGDDHEHLMMQDTTSFTKYTGTGTARTLLAAKVSYLFDLHGPSVTLDTGCSGSLVALNHACQSLLAGEASMALAGGVGLIYSPGQMIMSTQLGIFNGEGRCFSFDDRGSGYGRGEGVGMIALKRLDDAIRDGNVRFLRCDHSWSVQNEIQKFMPLMLVAQRFSSFLEHPSNYSQLYGQPRRAYQWYHIAEPVCAGGPCAEDF